MKRSAIRILTALLLCAVISLAAAESAETLKTGDAGDAVLELVSGGYSKRDDEKRDE